MEIDEAITLTQDRLAEEGGSMAELLGHFRERISPVLIGDPGWQRVLECATSHPVILAALLRLRAAAAYRACAISVSIGQHTRTRHFFKSAPAPRGDETAAILACRTKDTVHSRCVLVGA